ncbi:MAG: hypothetical protein J6W82_12310 [Bacteroidales bacterium]|nr:hypothetical protein [Bacteroidales bacterium]
MSRSTGTQRSTTQSSSSTSRSSSGVSRSNGVSRSSGSVNRSSAASADGRPSRTVTPARPRGNSAAESRGGERAGTRGSIRASELPRDNGPRIHPRERDFIEHGRPTLFYHRGPHFFGYRVRVLPARYVIRPYWGIDYYICDGIYYRWWNDCYYVCRPPFGILFDRALYNLDLVLCDFAYYSTVRRSYRIVNENYRTIAEQNEIIAQNNATIAAQNAAIASGNLAAEASYNLASRLGLFQSYANANQQYYYDDGIFFIEGANGQYQTIVPPAGALIAELPDDYEIITLDGEEYYKVDDTVYRTVVIDGKALFEVLGQVQN